MSNKNENIKKDLIDIYAWLYDISKCEMAINFFSKDILKKLRYKPEEMKETLTFDTHQTQKTTRKIKAEVSEIQTKEQVYIYFKEHMLPICQPDIAEEERNRFLKKITLEEIRYLYQLLLGIPLADTCKKIDAIYKIKDFFDNEERTVDLIKNLKA